MAGAGGLGDGGSCGDVGDGVGDEGGGARVGGGDAGDDGVDAADGVADDALDGHIVLSHASLLLAWLGHILLGGDEGGEEEEGDVGVLHVGGIGVEDMEEKV